VIHRYVKKKERKTIIDDNIPCGFLSLASILVDFSRDRFQNKKTTQVLACILF